MLNSWFGIHILVMAKCFNWFRVVEKEAAETACEVFVTSRYDVNILIVTGGWKRLVFSSVIIWGVFWSIKVAIVYI